MSDAGRGIEGSAEGDLEGDYGFPDAADYEDDFGGYVDAATIAWRFASVELGQAPEAPARRDVRDAPPVGPRRLREVMGSLVTGVCVITTVADGEDVAMTANSFTSVSLEPPLVLICIARTARFHSAVVEDGATWGVSILDADSAEVSTHFARPGRDRRRQFEGLDHHRGEVTGVALLTSSCATLECRTEVVYPGGDHSIVVGRVLAATKTAESLHPLVFHRGAYSWLRT